MPSAICHQADDFSLRAPGVPGSSGLMVDCRHHLLPDPGARLSVSHEYGYIFPQELTQRFHRHRGSRGKKALKRERPGRSLPGEPVVQRRTGAHRLLAYPQRTSPGPKRLRGHAYNRPNRRRPCLPPSCSTRTLQTRPLVAQSLCQSGFYFI